ncbi:MAG: sterol desaturase family protein [Deltaproteobacteria bacterium]|nr:sterol desaturase family protein [Deltaproteobacteria bacterium]
MARALRHVALPVWYLAGLAGLVVVHGLVQRDAWLGTAAWLGVVTLASALLFALEMLGPRWLADDDDGAAAYLRAQLERVSRGYSARHRAAFLGQALLCWMLCGLATVVLAHWLGAWLLRSSVTLRSAADVVIAWPPRVRVLVAFVLLDAWSYARHRIEHANGERGVLWRLVHRWHHTPTEIDLWTGMVVHPIEAVLVFAVPCAALAALGFERWELSFLFTQFLMITMPQHMNSGWTAGALGAVIHGPEAHTRHHSTDPAIRNANFGDCLTVWDRIFGTYRKPPPDVFQGPYGP